MPEPVRTCVGCRSRLLQSSLRRFVRAAEGWRGDAAGGPRSDGRGAYLCSERCARRVAKNKRYPGLAPIAQAAPGGWRLPEDDGPGV